MVRSTTNREDCLGFKALLNLSMIGSSPLISTNREAKLWSLPSTLALARMTARWIEGPISTPLQPAWLVYLGILMRLATTTATFGLTLAWLARKPPHDHSSGFVSNSQYLEGTRLFEEGSKSGVDPWCISHRKDHIIARRENTRK